METRELKLIKNKDGHGTTNYKICLPTKWVNFLDLDKEEKVAICLDNNSIIIKSKGDLKMEEIIKELKEELLNKEMTLLDLDNGAERITGSTTSLFDYEDEIRQDGSCNYWLEEDKEIMIEYLAKNTDEEMEEMTGEDKLNIEVKITDIRIY